MAKKQKTFEEIQAKYVREVIKALDKNPDIYQFCDLELIVPYDRSTLYKYHIDKIDAIKERLSNNKMKFKRVLRNQMRSSNNPTCLIALYKLLATEEEKDALSNKNRPETYNNEKQSTQEAFLQHLKDLGNAD